MDFYKEFSGPNAAYALELYSRYLEDPDSVDAATRTFFERWAPLQERPIPGVDGGGPAFAALVTGAVNLANAIRSTGHLSAHLDPLADPKELHPWHQLATYQLSDDDLSRLPALVVGGPLAEGAANALDAIEGLQQVYAGKVGYDYEHIEIPEEREWLRQAAECGEFRPPQVPVDKVQLLERLTTVDAFEQFLHRIFPGKTRFSIEGLDMLIPMLDEILGCAAEEDICTVMLGMAHRGRLNVLAHVLGKPYRHILAEFKDPLARFPTRDELGWTGDVKYHKGARKAIRGGDVVEMIVSMAPNPSHLEHVNPVIVGMSRGAGSKMDEPGAPIFFPAASLPILIHGDASFMGQGVVAETLNMSSLEGYSVGGALHIIANNQLGYTTLPQAGRSTTYASDLAKGFEIPIIHVNADDPIGCIEAARTAFAYREQFHKDFLIDLIGYRRYGHNEGDEPSFTQPVLYKQIQMHPRVRATLAQELLDEGLINGALAEEMYQDKIGAMQQALKELDDEPEEDVQDILEPQLKAPPSGIARRVNTSVPLKRLRELNQALLNTPEGFVVNRKIERGMRNRGGVLDNSDEATIDWATAEDLALASILADGIPVRMTGEDVERGTFSQRHAVFHNPDTGETFTPLQELPQAKAAFEIYNSPLSENAAVGFEFGFNVFDCTRLVIWEAQYGDFINTAQPMIDEFLLSARAKWEQNTSLVLLLPHGHEGQGPDHSTGRPERFLQMAADINLRLANCTTSAQYFHLLRRQAALLETDPLPLIVLTPKSLLRHPFTLSPPSALSKGRWMPVLDDPQAPAVHSSARRLVLCSGKVFVDLNSARGEEGSGEVGIVRMEQLYPFPGDRLSEVIQAYQNIQEVVWVQEEPQNMGAWYFVRPRIQEILPPDMPLNYIGRERSSSPAEGSTALHNAVQKRIIEQALYPEEIKVKEG